MERGPAAERRAALLEALILVLKRRINRAFQIRLVPEAFVALDKHYDLSGNLGGPYAFTMSRTITSVMQWMQRKGRSHHPILHMVEKGDKGQEKMPNDWDCTVVLVPKKDPVSGEWCVPFQAADLIAYESRLNISRHLEGIPHRVRGALVQIGTHIPLDRWYLDDETMRDAIARSPEVFKARAPG